MNIDSDILSPDLPDHITVRRAFCRRLLELNAMEAARASHDLAKRMQGTPVRSSRDEMGKLIAFIDAYGACVFPGWNTAKESIERAAADLS